MIMLASADLIFAKADQRLLEEKEERENGSPKAAKKNVQKTRVPAADIIKNGLDLQRRALSLAEELVEIEVMAHIMMAHMRNLVIAYSQPLALFTEEERAKLGEEAAVCFYRLSVFSRIDALNMDLFHSCSCYTSLSYDSSTTDLASPDSLCKYLIEFVKKRDNGAWSRAHMPFEDAQRALSRAAKEDYLTSSVSLLVSFKFPPLQSYCKRLNIHSVCAESRRGEQERSGKRSVAGEKRMDGSAKEPRLNQLTEEQSQNRGLHSQTIIPGSLQKKNAAAGKTGAGKGSGASGLAVSPGSEVGYTGGKGAGIRIGDLMFGLGSYKKQESKNIEKGSGLLVRPDGRLPFTEPRSAGLKEVKKFKIRTVRRPHLSFDPGGSLESREGVR
jgi:hypothetical protein